MALQFHIAQINIARMLAPIDDPIMAGFVARLDEINGLADASPGFVWRLQTEEGDATSLQPYADERIIVNLSVWETPEHLRHYVYNTMHTEVMRQRKSWFERLGDLHYALWWVPAGHIPSIEEAKERLRHLQIHGESEHAFSFASVIGRGAAPYAVSPSVAA